jgi:hypothetical protein
MQSDHRLGARDRHPAQCAAWRTQGRSAHRGGQRLTPQPDGAGLRRGPSASSSTPRPAFGDAGPRDHRDQRHRRVRRPAGHRGVSVISASSSPSTTSAPASPRLAYLSNLAVQRAQAGPLVHHRDHRGDRDRDLELVRSTIELGHAMGLRIVAEGIEDGTLELLGRVGCDLAQGYCISRPKLATSGRPPGPDPGSRDRAHEVEPARSRHGAGTEVAGGWRGPPAQG